MIALRIYLRELRTRRNISQEDLANAIGISRQQLMRWENGKTTALRGDALIKSLAFLDGSFEDAVYLVSNSINDNDGYNLAIKRLQLTNDKNVDTTIITTLMTEVQILKQRIDSLTNDVLLLKQR